MHRNVKDMDRLCKIRDISAQSTNSSKDLKKHTEFV